MNRMETLHVNYRDLLEKGQQIGRLGSWEYDLLKDKLLWSDEIYRIFEIDPASFKSNYDAFLSFVHPDDKEMVMQAYEKSNQSKSPYGPIIHRIITQKGNLKYVEEKGFTEYSNAGEPEKTYGIVRDITKERLAELELEKKTAYIEKILNSLPDLIFIATSDGFFQDAMAGIESDFYVSKESFIGRHYSEVLPEETVQMLTKAFSRLEKGEEHVTIEYELLLNESLHYYEARLSFFTHHEIVIVVRDITTQREMLSRMRRLMRLKELLVKISSTYITVDEFELDTTINNSLAELGDFVNADRFYIFDYDLVNMTASNTYEWCAEGISAQIEYLQDIPVDEMSEWIENHFNGREMIIDNVQNLPENDPVRLVLDPQGVKSIITMPLMRDQECTGFVGLDYVRDYYAVSAPEKELLSLFAEMLEAVSLRMDTQRKLYEKQMFLHNIMHQSGSIIAQKNRDGTYKLVNRVWEEVTGLAEAEVIGKTDLELFPEETAHQFMRNDKNVMEKGVPIETEEFLETTDGVRYFTSVKFPTRDSQGTIIGLCGIINEITDRKKAEEAEINRKKLEAENQAKSEFLSNMTHEIRTPLNAIVGFSEILDQADDLTDKQKKHVRTIRRSSQHLLSLVNDILDVSKIEAGASKVTLTHFSVQNMLENIRLMFTSQSAKKQIDLLFSTPEPPVRVISDDVKIRQILLNVIGNAVKFTEKGSVRVSVSMVQAPHHSTESGSSEEQLLCTVSDTGPGIPPEELSHIYDSFFQVRQGIKEGGTGLGLHITKKLVDVLKGTISVESELHKGTTFRISIPVIRASENSEAEILSEVLQSKMYSDKEQPKPIPSASEETPPPNLIASIREAVLNGDIVKVTELANGLHPQFHATRSRILAGLETYDYDSLVSFLSKLENREM